MTNQIFTQVQNKKKVQVHANVKFFSSSAVEGYIVFCTGIHEEAQEDQIYDLFSDYEGNIRNLQVPLDRKTGYLKGYAMIEYETFKEAQRVVSEVNNKEFLGRRLKVDFAFKKPPIRK